MSLTILQLVDQPEKRAVLPGFELLCLDVMLGT